ncbi:hypothetical protein B0H11DRAFT_833967 [Mycena galericulata]|nr:hypothetical protein B0H11DRAFT_833967 [Mycena galericulata]
MRAFNALHILALAAAPLVHGGVIPYVECQTGCNSVAVACYSAAGLVFGTVVATPDAPPAALACNNNLSTCATNCSTTALLAPTL